MRISLVLLTIIALVNRAPFVHAQDSTAAPPSAVSTTAAIQKLIDEAKSDLARSETDAKNAADKLGKATPETRPAAQLELDGAQTKLNTARQKLLTFEQADAALMLRSDLLKNMAGQTGLSTGTFVVIILVVILFLLLLVGSLKLWGKASRSAADESGDDSIARSRLAKAVTLGSMTFIVLVSVVILLCAGINAAVPPQSEKKTALFFDMAKWVLATVLPVVAAWVGGVMAYYFGKDNFKTGAENAEKIIKRLTPQQKLESQQAGESGIAMTSATVSSVAAGSNLADMTLDKLRSDFKKFERLPILDDKGCPLACLHLSTLNKYTQSLTEKDKTDATKMTLDALMKTLGWKPDASFATVAPTADLGQVQSLMKASKECSDVFVTADGSKMKRADRWITNDDIVKIADA